MRNYEETDDTDLPRGWTWASLSEVTEPVINIHPEWEPQQEFAYVDIGSICNLTFTITETKRFTGKSAPSRARRPVRPGDVLFSNVRTYLRNVALVPRGLQADVCSTGFTVLRPNGAVESHYLFRYVLTESFIARVTPQQTGTHYPATSDRVILGERIPLPPLPEQRRIVAKLEDLLGKVHACKKRLERIPLILTRFRQAMLAAACSGRLTEDWRRTVPMGRDSQNLLKEIGLARKKLWHKNGVSPAAYVEPAGPSADDLPDLPETWCWARAEQVCDFITKGTTPAASKLSAARGDIPFLKVYNLTNTGRLDFTVKPTFVSRITHRDELSRSVVKPGDVLMNIVGPPLGKVSIVPSLYPEWNLNQAIAIFRPLPGLRNNFLAYCLLCTDILYRATRRAKATVGQHNLTLEICRDLELPLPPKEEQAEILRRVEAFFKLADQIESRHNVAKTGVDQLTQSILGKAFRGELVPQDPKDEPAWELLERIKGRADKHELQKRQTVAI